MRRLGWPLMLGMLYLEFFAIWAAFRPSIQRFWVFVLIGFHVGSVILMGILFAPNVLLLGLFFLTFPQSGRVAASPVSSWRRTLGELPLLGFFAI